MPSNFTFYTFYMLCYTEILKRDNMQRKIVQVILKEKENLEVLCDDGTIWKLRTINHPTKYWTQIDYPKIPGITGVSDIEMIMSQLDNIYTMLRDN